MDFILLPQSSTEEIITKSLSLSHFSGLEHMFNYNCLITQDAEDKVLVCSLM